MLAVVIKRAKIALASNNAHRYRCCLGNNVDDDNTKAHITKSTPQQIVGNLMLYLFIVIVVQYLAVM